MKKGSSKFNLTIEEVCDHLVDGRTMGEIAVIGGASLPTFLRWIEGDSDRSARVRDARTKMAKLWDERATAVIEGATSAFELAKAKELAHHYRWRASKVAPAEYGDKQHLDVEARVRSVREMTTEELLAIAQGKA